MNNSSKSKTGNLEARNKANEAFNKWLESQKQAEAELVAYKEEKRKQKRPTTTNFSLSANVLLLIYKAGKKGIKVSEILSHKPLQFERKNKVSGEMEVVTTFSDDTVKRDWNKAGLPNGVAPMQYANQKMIDKGFNIAFEVTTLDEKTKYASHDNLIKVMDFCKDDLLAYIKTFTNFDEVWLKEEK